MRIYFNIILCEMTKIKFLTDTNVFFPLSGLDYCLYKIKMWLPSSPFSEAMKVHQTQAAHLRCIRDHLGCIPICHFPKSPM